ncbi:MAG: response regulator [Candidatus Omnitrophica bacterium]|nr:response regulator [Candidatus Omnitrophota bacterium]
MAHKLLLVEDEHMLAYTLGELITLLYGFEVFLAGSVAESLRLIETQQPAVILLDLHLADGSGMQVLEGARRLGSKAIIYVITGFEDPELDVQARSLGAHDYLVKPVDPKELKAKLDEAVGRVTHTQGD